MTYGLTSHPAYFQSRCRVCFLSSRSIYLPCLWDKQIKNDFHPLSTCTPCLFCFDYQNHNASRISAGTMTRKYAGTISYLQFSLAEEFLFLKTGIFLPIRVHVNAPSVYRYTVKLAEISQLSLLTSWCLEKTHHASRTKLSKSTSGVNIRETC